MEIERKRTVKVPSSKPAAAVNLPGNKEAKCTACGKVYSKQIGNFYQGHSALYIMNDSYIPVCITCVDKLYNHYLEALGSEKLALKRICQKFDWYYGESLYDRVAKVGGNSSLVKQYVNRSNMKQYIKKTYDTTIDEMARLPETGSTFFEDGELIDILETKEISKEAVDKWGKGYTPEEYQILEEHYDLLKTQFPDSDYLQDALIRDLCSIKNKQIRAYNEDNMDMYDKLTKLYHSTLKTGDFKTKTTVETGDSNMVLGKMINTIESYCPADIYKDKKLFEDYDGVKDYFERFVLRPIKNFFTGSTEPDEEFSVLNGDDDV